MSVMIDGKPVFGIVNDPMMYSAITSMEPLQLNNVLKMFRVAKTGT